MEDEDFQGLDAGSALGIVVGFTVAGVLTAVGLDAFGCVIAGAVAGFAVALFTWQDRGSK